jgi:hypothetical protein
LAVPVRATDPLPQVPSLLIAQAVVTENEKFSGNMALVGMRPFGVTRMCHLRLKGDHRNSHVETGYLIDEAKEQP